MRTVEVLQLLGTLVGSLAAVSLDLERRMLKQFRSQQATSAENAIPLPEVRGVSRWRLSRLIKHNIVRSGANGLFYLDEASHRLLRKRRLTIILPAIAVALATVVILQAGLRN